MIFEFISFFKKNIFIQFSMGQAWPLSKIIQSIVDQLSITSKLSA